MTEENEIRAILTSPDDVEPWPLAAGALVSWRDDGRPGVRFCARLVPGASMRVVSEPLRRALETGPFPWHTLDTGMVDRDGPVMVGEIRHHDGGATVALAQAHEAPGGVLVAGRLAHWLDPAPYQARFALLTEWRPGDENGLVLADIRVVPASARAAGRPGFPVPLRIGETMEEARVE